MHMKSDFQPLYKTDWIVCLQFKDPVPDRLQRLVLCVGGYLKTFMNTYIQVNRGGINCLGGKTLVLYDVKHVFVNSVDLLTRALMQTRFSKHSYVLISEYFFVCSVDLWARAFFCVCSVDLSPKKIVYSVDLLTRAFFCAQCWSYPPKKIVCSVDLLTLALSNSRTQ